MKLRLVTALAALAFVTVGGVSDVCAGLRVGGGIHYLRTVGDLKDAPEFDENQLGLIGAVKYKGGLLTLEGDVEWIKDYAGSKETMWQPAAYAFLGGLIYGGAGIGFAHLSGSGWQDPFYVLRAGVDLNLGPVDLDAFASYHFQKSDDLSYLGSDDLNSITFGALIFFGM